jgi:hypothetical protein
MPENSLEGKLTRHIVVALAVLHADLTGPANREVGRPDAWSK